MAQVVPRRCRAGSDMAAAPSDVVPCLGPTLRGEEERGTGAECCPEERARGEEPDVLPIQPAVVASRPLLRRSSHAAPSCDRKLSFQRSCGATARACGSCRLVRAVCRGTP